MKKLTKEVEGGQQIQAADGRVLGTEEVELLNDLMTDAESLAAMGRAVDGYKFLEFGLCWAEAAQQRGFLWAEELIRRYQGALDSYAASYGLPRD